ncbi:MAG: hypothetical protein HY854_21425 [Burkholderiales bacterium]|nr:hypothetical protein [Burkholderiales bacterium]
MTPTATRCTLFACVLAASTMAAAQQPQNFQFRQGEGRGTCWVAFPAGNLPGTGTPSEVRFSVRARDGNFVTEILVNGWKKAQENAASDSVRPMALAFDTGKETRSRSGGYSTGFNDAAWGGWGAGPTSDAAMEMLREAKTVQIRFDGVDYARTDLQMKGLATTSLDNCLKKMRGQ